MRLSSPILELSFYNNFLISDMYLTILLAIPSFTCTFKACFQISNVCTDHTIFLTKLINYLIVQW